MIYWPLMALCKKTKILIILIFFSSAHSSPFICSERDHSFTPLDPRSEAMAGIIFRTCGILSLSPSRSCVCTALTGRLSGPPFPAFRRIRAARQNILLFVTKEYIYISRYLSVRTCNQFGEIAAYLFWFEFFLNKNGYRITGQKSSDLTLLVFCTLQPCLLYPPPRLFQ